CSHLFWLAFQVIRQRGVKVIGQDKGEASSDFSPHSRLYRFAYLPVRLLVPLVQRFPVQQVTRLRMILFLRPLDPGGSHDLAQRFSIHLSPPSACPAPARATPAYR